VKRKSKLRHPRPSSPNKIVIDDDLVLGRNRRVVEYGKIVHEKEEELSDYVKIRLLIARMKALEAYRKAQV
jgi:hypothetical protein